MPAKRLIYQNWIVELGRDPYKPLDDSQMGLVFDTRTPAASAHDWPCDTSDAPDCRSQAVKEAVARALERLSAPEREFIVRHYFMGESYRELSEATCRTFHRLEGTHTRALRKLRRFLSPFMQREFGVGPEQLSDCPICASPERPAIDQLLRNKDPRDTWRLVFRQLRDRFGITIKTPQTVIGHIKYHI